MLRQLLRCSASVVDKEGRRLHVTALRSAYMCYSGQDLWAWTGDNADITLHTREKSVRPRISRKLMIAVLQ